MAEQWYFGWDNKRFGPFSAAQLKELAALGKLRPKDTVWKEGIEKGMLADKVKNLFPAPEATATKDHTAPDGQSSDIIPDGLMLKVIPEDAAFPVLPAAIDPSGAQHIEEQELSSALTRPADIRLKRTQKEPRGKRGAIGRADED
jgi:GYF domain 2